MAVVTITIEDAEGGVNIGTSCDVPIPEDDAQATGAMHVAAMAMRLLDMMAAAAKAELEGKSE